MCVCQRYLPIIMNILLSLPSFLPPYFPPSLPSFSPSLIPPPSLLFLLSFPPLLFQYCLCFFLHMYYISAVLKTVENSWAQPRQRNKTRCALLQRYCNYFSAGHSEAQQWESLWSPASSPSALGMVSPHTYCWSLERKRVKKRKREMI